MSVLGKIWKVTNKDPETALLEKLLKNRGINGEVEAEHFFNPDATRDFHDPFLMKDMERAVERIRAAITDGERVMIFGDYDVDGITGSAILMRALTKLGVKVSYRLPHRVDDGYGLREKFIHEFKELNVGLAITVDNGISCFNEVALASELGIDVIITDHHTIPERIPAAYAILHPKLPGDTYPFSELTGSGVALKFAQALYERLITDDSKFNKEEEVRKLLDLASMGTIGDLGLMFGENRYIVKNGLDVMEHTRWPGLSRLKQFAGVRGKVSAQSVGFFIGPRINAAGRISHASHALDLLLNNEGKSEALAAKLEKLNQDRQKLTYGLMEIADTPAYKQSADPIIIVSHPEFHTGLIGLLAAKLSEKYYRPAIVMEERKKTLVGSCRSIPGVNIVEALVTVKDLLTHFGGHAAAAGFELPKSKLSEFKKRMKAHIKTVLRTDDCKPHIVADCEIDHKDITVKTAEMLARFEPFGVGNETPRFLCKNLQVHDYRTVGAEKTHLKIRVGVNGTQLDCIGFRLGEFARQLDGDTRIDAICELEENEWKGNKRLQFRILDFRVVA